MKRIKDYHEEECNTWFQAHHFQHEDNVELRKENERLRQRLRAANMNLLNNIGAHGAPPTAARLRSRTPIRRRARSADPGARGAPLAALPPTAAGGLGTPLTPLAITGPGAHGASPTDPRLRSRTPIRRRRTRSADPGARGAPLAIIPPTAAGDLGAPLTPLAIASPGALGAPPNNIMQVVEAQRVHIGQFRNEMEQMDHMPRTPIPSLMSMAIPGSPLTPFATTPGGAGAPGAPPLPRLLTGLGQPWPPAGGTVGAPGAPRLLLNPRVRPDAPPTSDAESSESSSMLVTSPDGEQ